MTAEVFTPTVAVTMTPSAVKHVRKQLEKKPDAKGIRLAIKKSGCERHRDRFCDGGRELHVPVPQSERHRRVRLRREFYRRVIRYKD